MDESPLPSIIVFVVCLFGSMVCSAAETAFASVGRAKMMSLSDDGDKRARRVLSVIDRFDSALSAILICNNVFNIGCATAATLIAIKIGGTFAVTIATLISTVVIFLSAEMLPKRFAKDCPEAVSTALAPVMLASISILRPFIAAINAVTGLVTRIVIGKSKTQVTYTENEVEELIDTVADDETLPPEHGSLIRSAFGFSATPVSEIETSWKNTSKLPFDADRDTVIAIARSVQHTRFPVVEKSKPIGVLNIRGYLRACIVNEDLDMRKIMSPPCFIMSDTPADDALSEMSRQKTNLAFVRRPNGEVSGIITVEDLLEYLVGDMDDETDTEENV